MQRRSGDVQHQRLYGSVHHTDGAAAVGTGEVQFDRPRPEQRASRCEGRKSQAGAIAYDVHYALEGTGGVLGPWTTMTLTSPKKVTISGLTPAGTYQFQVRALVNWVTWIGARP